MVVVNNARRRLGPTEPGRSSGPVESGEMGAARAFALSAHVLDLALAVLAVSGVEIPDANDGHFLAVDDRGVGLRASVCIVCDCDLRRVAVPRLDLHAGDELDFP